MERSKRNIALSLVVVMFLAAFEGTVVATAAPAIVGDLQGFDQVSRMFSFYLLAEAVSTPIYGKLADIYGRKRVLLSGIFIFLCGSLLCGLSQTMGQLVAFRALQGLGAGSILTITFTIIGDIFTLKERSVVAGVVSTVWGVAGLAGPLLGGLCIDMLSWHWIFFINIPFCLLCMAALYRYLSDPVLSKQVHIDYAGSIFLAVTIVSVLYAIVSGYQDGSWQYALGLAVLSGWLFVKAEQRAKDPILPFSILTCRANYITAVTFGVSILLIAANVYIPLYVQSVLGQSATAAGLIITAMSISWFFGSVTVAGRMQRWGGRTVIAIGAALLLFSSLLLANVTEETSLYWLGTVNFLFGIGFSYTLNTITFLVQDSVSYAQRGVAVSVNTLTRAVGQALGVSFLGTLMNLRIAQYGQDAGISLDAVNHMLQNSVSLTGSIRDAVFAGLHEMYLLLAGLAAGIAFLVWAHA